MYRNLCTYLIHIIRLYSCSRTIYTKCLRVSAYLPAAPQGFMWKCMCSSCAHFINYVIVCLFSEAVEHVWKYCALAQLCVFVCVLLVKSFGDKVNLQSYIVLLTNAAAVLPIRIINQCQETNYYKKLMTRQSQ